MVVLLTLENESLTLCGKLSLLCALLLQVEHRFRWSDLHLKCLPTALPDIDLDLVFCFTVNHFIFPNAKRIKI